VALQSAVALAESQSFRCPAASGYLFGKRQKGTKKRFFFSQWMLSANSTSVLLIADARIPARDNRRSGFAGDWYKES